MEEKVIQIKSYFTEYNIHEWEIIESNNFMGHRINVRWKQEDIQCEKRIFTSDDAMLVMAEHFHMTRNILKANVTR
ncbi:MAG: hypothetical protein ACP5N7_06380 [Candidatus Pacearchaeota archaeon]